MAKFFTYESRLEIEEGVFLHSFLACAENISTQNRRKDKKLYTKVKVTYKMGKLDFISAFFLAEYKA